MCGIIHVKRSKGILANKAVIKRYNKQKDRGSEGFGFIEIKDGIVSAGKRAEDEEDILKALEASTAEEIFFHHRTPTSTPNFVEATHPIVVKNKKLKYHYYVIHNGIIYNDTELKKEHEKKGFVYTTEIKRQYITKKSTYSNDMFNDSEALAIDFATSLESGLPMKSRGSIAIMVLQVEKKTKKAIALYYARNSGNPLKVEIQGTGSDQSFFGISSESGKEITPNVLYRYDYATGEITSEKKEIGSISISCYDDDGGYRGGYLGLAGGSVYNGYIPPYGHWDPVKECWIEPSRSNWDDNGYPISHLDGSLQNDDEPDPEFDSDFDYDWDEMVEGLREDIKEAKRLEDWDTVSELEMELEEMMTKFLDCKEEAKRQDRANRIGQRLGF